MHFINQANYWRRRTLKSQAKQAGFVEEVTAQIDAMGSKAVGDVLVQNYSGTLESRVDKPTKHIQTTSEFCDEVSPAVITVHEFDSRMAGIYQNGA